MKICNTPKCKNITRKGRNDCERCRKRKSISKYPIFYAYKDLKKNAKRRNKICTISLSEFTLWCEKNNYIALRGLGKDEMSIDCKIPELGYTYDNMRMVSKSINSKLNKGSITEADMEYFPNYEKPPF